MGHSRRWRTAALCALVALTAAAQWGPYLPYREKLADGVVDWDEGWIRADASAPLMKGVPPAQARVDAQRVATMKAQAAALRIAMRLPVTSERRLESWEALRIRVKGIVSGGKVTAEGLQGDAYKLSLLVPINGVTGIASEVSKVTLPPPEPEDKSAAKTAPPNPKAAEPTAEAAPGPVLVVDAREAGARPALQPRIVDEQGREVYSQKTVKPKVAREKTIARYVAPAEGSAAKPTSWRDAPSLSGWPLALADPPWSFLFAQRAPSQRPRGEGQAIEVSATAASGSLKADLVVTEETAKKLREAESKTGVLSEGRVIVVVRADAGGVEGRRLVPAPSSPDDFAKR